MSEEQPKKKSMWEIMATAVNKRYRPTDEELANMSSFVFCKYISSDPLGCMVANEISKYPKITPKNQYLFARSVIPKQKYLIYPKKEKIQGTKELEAIMNYYKCNQKTALEYLNLMKDEEIVNLVKKFEAGVQK